MAKSSIVLGAVLAAALSAIPATAWTTPFDAAAELRLQPVQTATEPVRWRGRFGHGGRVGIGIGAGILGGILLNEALGNYYFDGPDYYGDVYAPRYIDRSGVAYCARRYRSYDYASGTYLGYDGRRHSCP